MEGPGRAKVGTNACGRASAWVRFERVGCVCAVVRGVASCVVGSGVVRTPGSLHGSVSGCRLRGIGVGLGMSHWRMSRAARPLCLGAMAAATAAAGEAAGIETLAH